MPSYELSAEKRQQFSGIIVLKFLLDNGGKMPLLLEDNDLHLEPTLDWLHNRGHLEIVDNEFYSLSATGKESVGHYEAHFLEFVKSFDIYSYVDLDEGVFAFERVFDFEEEEQWTQYLDGDNWDDLRIPIAELKGLDPLELVFLGFMNEGLFYEEDNWQLELVDDQIWQELEAVCNDAIQVESLAFDDPEDGHIEGGVFLADIIKEGVELTRELSQIEQELEAQDEEGEEYELDEEEEEELDLYYQPYYDPFYVSPIWLTLWWL